MTRSENTDPSDRDRSRLAVHDFMEGTVCTMERVVALSLLQARSSLLNGIFGLSVTPKSEGFNGRELARGMRYKAMSRR